MRQPVRRSAVLVALGLAVTACLIVARHVADTPKRSAESAPPSSAASAGANQSMTDPHERVVRDVTPQGVSRVFMSPPAAGSRRMPTHSAIHITQAGATPVGEIRGEGGAVRLYGVAFPDGKKICTTAAGERWACGRRAFIALHNRIAFEEVDCELRGSADPPQADCFAGGVNLAAWLLAEGLAQLAADTTDQELVAAEAEARSNGRGLWSDVQTVARPAQPQRP
jgi:endonuclease YncB( thermonuclease family)